MALESFRRSINRCEKCGQCRAKYNKNVQLVCPVREATGGFEHTFSRGRVLIAGGILDGKLSYTPALIENIYQCLGCKNCVEQCGAIDFASGKPLIDTPEITRAMRVDIVKQKLGQPAVLSEIDLNVRKAYNPFGEAPHKRKAWASELDIPKEGEIVYFTGCYASYRSTRTARATALIMKNAGLDPACLGEDEWCCGVPQFWGGNVALAEELAMHNVQALKKAGAKKVVTSCAGCFHSLKYDYPEIMGSLPFEVVHSSQLITGLVEDGKISLNDKALVGEIVTYHDPCHLGRYEKVYEEPRQILNRIPGIRLVEMQRNRGNAWCCGGGSVVYSAFPGLTGEIAESRVSEASEVNANAIVTGCPLCATVLSRPARRTGIEVEDLAVVVAKSMGIKV